MVAILSGGDELRPQQNDCHFACIIFKVVWLEENCCIFLNFHLYLFKGVQFNNNPALVKIIAWCQADDKSLSEPVMVQFFDAKMRLSAQMRQPLNNCSIWTHFVCKLSFRSKECSS